VAQQFEALFLQTVLKAMRDATPHDGLFDSEQTRMYESMYDQQLVQVLATRGRGMGLAALIEKQMSPVSAEAPLPDSLPWARPARALPLSPAATGFSLPGAQALDVSVTSAASSIEKSRVPPGVAEISRGARAFIERLWPQALETSRATGIPAHFMVAQAALETGWGQSEPRLPDGSSSHNLFGIKAGADWTGASVTATTTEVVNGLAQRQSARFRAYASYHEAFQDYARLLGDNPRYAEAFGARDPASFARGLQQAGYASDPQYALKLIRIITSNALRPETLPG
jgi:flagellar protein FlgJ